MSTKRKPNYTNIIKCADVSAIAKGLREIEKLTDPTNGLAPGAYSSATPQNLAAQQVIQLVEGWRYLSESIAANLANSYPNAIHAAYYAQLKAAISIFASYGILINSNRIKYFDCVKRRYQAPESPTHVATWALWEKFAQLNIQDTLISESVWVFEQVTLQDLKSAFGRSLGPTAAPSWGYDFRRFGKDKHVRNTFSYDPVWRDQPIARLDAARVEGVHDIWNSILPNESGRLTFETRYIAHVLRAIRDSWSGRNSDREWRSAKDRAIEAIANAGGYDEEYVQRHLDYLETVDSKILDTAAMQIGDASSVMSRATVLLGTANLAFKRNLAAVHPDTSNTLAWLREWLEASGVNDSTSGMSGIDLALDYEEALDELTAAFKGPKPELTWSASTFGCAYQFWRRPHAAIAWNFSNEIYGP